MKLSKHVDWLQIRALLRKDYLARIRQPWMTIVQYVWPCLIFLSLYVLRNRFQAKHIDECQFPTRQLQTNGILPFFQSYVCTIENDCSDPKRFEETTDFEIAPVTPLLNIVQIFLDTPVLYDSVTKLPVDKNFIGAVTTIVTNGRFKEIEGNADKLVRMVPEIQKMVGENFNIEKLFADDRTFSNSGNILCGKPFPRSDNIRFINNVLYSQDFNGADPDEIAVMPTAYCKQLYRDVTNTNNGKITWKQLKPILQGKILYGPSSDRNDEIIKFANQTFVDMGRLRDFFKALNTTVRMLHTDESFRESFEGLIELAKSPLVQMIAGGNVNINLIEGMLNGILHDETVAKTLETIASIFECFSTDRFIPVDSEAALEDEAFKLNQKKLFFAGLVFENATMPGEIPYKIRMRTDDTPVTVENRNRFWFPGPEASFELDMRYHRGFIEIQHAVDVGIIKFLKQEKVKSEKEVVQAAPSSSGTGLTLGDDLDSFEDDIEEETTTVGSTTENLDSLYSDLSKKINISSSDLNKFTNKSSLDDYLDFKDDEEGVEVDEEDPLTLNSTSTSTTTSAPSRRKRAPQFSLLDLFLGGGSKKKTDEVTYNVAKEKFYTKQFPYPAYTRDDFKKGLYLAQSIQMSFFIALIVHVSSSVRQKIWMKESGNIMLMRSMGLKSTSDSISWAITTLIELSIVFVLGLAILYSGGILMHSSRIFLFVYQLVFGLCLIAFCYMCSMFFQSASIGSVSTVILFLTTFLPYIIIISLGATLSFASKFFASLSFSTAFCYAWRHIMRLELQHHSANFMSAFEGSMEENDLKFGILMMLLDAVIYFLVGLFYEKLTHEDTTFYNVNRTKLDKSIGAELLNVDVIYENNKKALDNVSITFKRDEVTCLLGRNGAGKSTIIKLLTGQILPVVGDVHLPLDYDLISGLRNNAERVGLCSQNDILIPNLTAKEHLQLYARIKLTKGFETEVQRTLDNLKMGKYKHYRASELSGGFKRRLCIAIAFLGSPNLVILDEPCSSVDTKARKYIWELIQTLRKDRAVILATHHLDEAESLSDKVVVLENGKAILEESHEELKNRFTNTLYIDMTLKSLTEGDRSNIINEINKNLDQQTNLRYGVSKLPKNKLQYKLTYTGTNSLDIDLQGLFDQLNQFQDKRLILSYDIKNENLMNIFSVVNSREVPREEIGEPEIVSANGHHDSKPAKQTHSTFEILSTLFKKRFLHFRRNYRLLICILVLPALFEIIAMFFMTIRPPGEYDKILELSPELYHGAAEFYTRLGNGTGYQRDVTSSILERCEDDANCYLFNSSEEAFNWLLSTNDQFSERRYGGLTSRKEKHFIWYNNKGYHSMPIWLNMLDSAMLQAEMENTSYSIRTINHPLKIEEDELTLSSILQQVADAGISLILLLAFSLVVAGGSVYIVNERVRGDKRQQRLAGIKTKYYWGVAYLWDAMIFLIAILLAVIVFKIFAIPAYVDKQQLGGICLLLFFYGFASIPAIHLFEKLFNDASFANMSLFCLNVITALGTLTTIILFDILGESETSEHVRNLLNRVFLILPQHALADGLIELSKNYIQAEIFKRYYIDTYQSPLSILEPHIIGLIIMGVIFMVMNSFAEKKLLQKFMLEVESAHSPTYELQTVHSEEIMMNGNGKKKETLDQILSVDHLSKHYREGEDVVSDVSFKIHYGECFGLLGTNGAGKSTIFSILSGDQLQSSGTYTFFTTNCLSYCPQSSFLDPLLTVEEVIEFYGKLRNVDNIDKLVFETLREYHLEPYKRILVKNLSGGNRRKLCVAVSCFGNTDIVLMDEPTSDMDPVTRAIVYRTIERLNSQNRSILLTSHSISEIDHICQRIAILKDGRLLTVDTPENLTERYGNNYLITIYLEENREVDLVRSIKREFNVSQELVQNKNSLQFVCKVQQPTEQRLAPQQQQVQVQQEQPDDVEKLPAPKKSQVTINLNNNTIDSSPALASSISALVVKLHQFAQANRLRYTVARCLLDQVFEDILQNHEEDHSNEAFVENSE